MYEQIGYCSALLFLAGLAIYDIKWKRIPVAWVLTFGIIAVMYFLIGEQVSISQMIYCMLPGAGLLALSFVTKEKIGYGDGITALVLGFFLRELYCISVIGLGIMLTGFYSLLKILSKNREPIPLIPFWLAALEVIFIYV